MSVKLRWLESRERDGETPRQLKNEVDTAGTGRFASERRLLSFCHMTARLLLLIVLSIGVAHAHLRVVGNLAVVAKPIGHAGTEASPVKANVGQLWCGVQNLGETVTIKYAQFTRVRDGKVFEATIKDNRASIHVGKAPATVAGKYRCEVRTEDEEVLSGNSFIYLPPVLKLPTGTAFAEHDSRPPRVVADPKKIEEGHKMTLSCPVFGYPQPFVHWEKDDAPISGGSVQYDGDDLIIESVSTADAGVYKCIADNSFPVFVDGPAMPHQLVYEQKIDVV